jgi:hypothetical protein
MYHMKLGRGFQPVKLQSNFVKLQSNLVKPQSNPPQGLFGLAKLPTLAAAPAGPFTQGLRLRVGGSNAVPAAAAAAAAASDNIASVGSSIQEALTKLRIVPAFGTSSSSGSGSVGDPSRLRTQSPGTDGSSSSSSSSSNAAPASSSTSGSLNDRIQALLRSSSGQQQQQQQQQQDAAAAGTTSSSTAAEPVHAPSSSSGSGQLLQNLPQVAMLGANERDATPQPGTTTAHNVQQMLHHVDMESLRSAVAAVTAARLEGRARVMQRRSHSGKLMKQMKAASASS